MENFIFFAVRISFDDWISQICNNSKNVTILLFVLILKEKNKDPTKSNVVVSSKLFYHIGKIRKCAKLFRFGVWIVKINQ